MRQRMAAANSTAIAKNKGRGDRLGGSCGASRREHYFLHVSKGGKLVITKGNQFTKSFMLKILTIFGPQKIVKFT